VHKINFQASRSLKNFIELDACWRPLFANPYNRLLYTSREPIMNSVVFALVSTVYNVFETRQTSVAFTCGLLFSTKISTCSKEFLYFTIATHNQQHAIHILPSHDFPYYVVGLGNISINRQYCLIKYPQYNYCKHLTFAVLSPRQYLLHLAITIALII